jgi:hypothetical protein
MQDSTWQRWGGAAGILATACFATESVLLRHSPSTNQPTSDLTGYFSSQPGNGAGGHVPAGLRHRRLLFFLGALRRRLGRDGPIDGLASVGFAGGVAASAIVVVAAGMVAVLAFRPDTTPPVARALYDANGLLVAFAGFPVAVLLAASSTAVLSSGVLPRWLGWFGLAATAAQLAGAASFQRSGLFMPQGDSVAVQAEVGTLLLWLVATSILMLLGSSTRESGAEGRSAAHIGRELR